jgi:hypothetical protein
MLARHMWIDWLSIVIGALRHPVVIRPLADSAMVFAKVHTRTVTGVALADLAGRL